MNKKILFLVAMLMLVLALVACGEQNKPTTNASGDQIVSNEKENGNGINDEEPTDPYVANIPNEIVDFYKEKVEEIEKKYKADQAQMLESDPDVDVSSLTNLKYDLVFLDDNNTPELVVTQDGVRTILYTYDAGKVIYTMKDGQNDDTDEYGWAFGIAGNVGYEFIPRKNIIRSYSNEMTGLKRYYMFNTLDNTDFQLKSKYDELLFEGHFDDKNNNGEIDEGEDAKFLEEPVYYYGNKVITKEEFDSYLIEGDYEELAGTKSYADMIKALDLLINQK